MYLCGAPMQARMHHVPYCVSYMAPCNKSTALSGRALPAIRNMQRLKCMLSFVVA